MSDELLDLFKFTGLKDVDENCKDEIDTAVDEADAISYHDIMTEEYELNDTRVAMIGNVDSGKSTLIGVLTNATLDDGRGGQLMHHIGLRIKAIYGNRVTIRFT